MPTFFKENVRELERRTSAYWNVSRAWSGKSGEEISTHTAMTICRENMGMNESRPLVRYSEKLLHELIHGGSVLQGEGYKQAKVIEFKKTSGATK